MHASAVHDFSDNPWEHVKNCTYDLQKQFLSLKVLDKTVWKTHFDLETSPLSVDDAPVVDERTVAALHKFSSLKVENESGIALVTMPKGLSLDILDRLAKSPKNGRKTGIGFLPPSFTDWHRNTVVEKTHTLVVSNSILEGTRKLPTEEHHEFLKKVGCEMPQLLPMATLSILTYVSSPEPSPVRLYSNNCYTRCSEKVDGLSLAFGHSSMLCFHSFQYNATDPSLGVGAMLKV